jgi:hypothetical protein
MQGAWGARPMPPCLARLVCLASAVQASVLLPYGIGLGLGKGATPQIAAGQGGSGGVGIRNSFPWVDAEPPVMH